jgi:hypothetical protein
LPATAAATAAATVLAAAAAAAATDTGGLWLVCIPVDVLDFIHMHHLLTSFNL